MSPSFTLGACNWLYNTICAFTPTHYPLQQWLAHPTVTRFHPQCLSAAPGEPCLRVQMAELEDATRYLGLVAGVPRHLRYCYFNIYVRNNIIDGWRRGVARSTSARA